MSEVVPMEVDLMEVEVLLIRAQQEKATAAMFPSPFHLLLAPVLLGLAEVCHSLFVRA